VSQEPAPLAVKLAAFVSLLGLAGLAFQVWEGLPAPARWNRAEQPVIHPALVLEAPTSAPPATASEESSSGTANWQELRIRGADESGRSAFFRVMLLSPSYRWQPGSAEQVLDGDRQAHLSELPDRRKLAAQLSSSRAVLALGTDEESAEDELLSTARARNLAQWLGRSFQGDKAIFAIDAGRYRAASAPPEDRVGRIIVVGVSVLDRGADLAGALRNAMADNEGTPLSVRLYSRFELVPLDGESGGSLGTP